MFRNHNIVMEARGRSMGPGGWEMPVTDSMAYFVSVFPGTALRAQILCWLMTRGLVEASKGRDELANIVNKMLAGQADQPNPQITPRFNTSHSGIQAVGEATTPFAV